MMKRLKFVTTFIIEFIHSYPHRKSIQSLGAKTGTIHALLLWCYTFSRYCVTNKIPWYICLRPWKFESYMNGNSSNYTIEIK